MTRRALIVALAAGSITNAAQAEEIDQTTFSPDGRKEPTGYVYANGLTGERVVSFQSAQPVSARGAGWAWSNAVFDPCTPGDDTAIVIALHDSTLGIDGIATPDDLGAFQDWMETPGDSIVNLISFGLFTAVLDPEEDGVIDHEMILVLTENDRAIERSGAVASTVVQFTELPGADDENGDGTVDFTEANLWIMVFDLESGATPFDIEIGDTNGVYDGAYPGDGLFGIPGTDRDGDGMIDSGFVVAWRQPGVDEGNQITDRFPELIGVVDDNGPVDPETFANMADIGVAIAHPSDNLACYTPFGIEWPLVSGCDDTSPSPIGTWDFFAIVDALGTDVGLFNFGHFSCASETPWASMYIAFNVDLLPPDPCPCDMNGDGILDLADISAFVIAFQGGDLAADMNGDGILDLADITEFILCFQAGCP